MCYDKVTDHYFDDEMGKISCMCVGKYGTHPYPRIYVASGVSVRV
jgi:hypothetical protein